MCEKLSFRIFPCNADKIPLIKGWQEAATTDPEQIRLWQDLFRDKLAHWAIPTGATNDLLVLDADVKGGGLETIKTLHIPITMSQRTKNGGLHFFFRYPKDGKHYGNRAKFMPGLDVRGAGGYVCYYGVDPKGPVNIAEAPPWLLRDPTPVVPTGQAVKVSAGIAEGIVNTSLEAIRDAPEGESNNVLNIEAFRIGQLVAGGTITREYAEAALFRAAKERGKPDFEAKATIKSGLDGGVKKPITSPFGEQAPVASITMLAPPGPPARWTPEPFDRQDLLNTSNLRKPQLFKDWSTEDIHITTADGGTGKTTLKLYEACCLALGDRFLGFKCESPGGKTLYITGEDTGKKLGAMIGAIIRQMGLFIDAPGNDEKIQTILRSIIVKKDADLCLITKDRASGFLQPNFDAMRKVREAVSDIQPKMIVFDPISSFWGSEAALNDMNKAVTKFMSELAEHSGACVEMINHMGKQSSATKDMTQFAGRGGSGLPSNARVSRVLRPVFEDEYLELIQEPLTEKQSAMLCMVNKFTDGSPLYNKPFVILRDGFIFTRKNLTDQKAREAENQLSDNERVFQFIKEERARDKYPSVKVVVAHFVLNGNPLKKAKVERALEMLEYDGHMGERLKKIENPDMTNKDKVYVITDLDGREA